MTTAADALQDPFNPPPPPLPRADSPAASAGATAAAPSTLHRPTFTQVLSAADLSAVLSSPGGRTGDDTGDDDHDGEGAELPTAPPISHSLLAAPDFDVSAFLLERRHTPLNELRTELREYLSELRQSLVRVINDEYEAFVGLSVGLKRADVDRSLDRIRQDPHGLVSVRSQVLRVEDEVARMRDEMAAVLEDRKRAREAKALARRLLATEDAVDKVEGLLNLDPFEPPSSATTPSTVGKKPRRLTLSVADSPTKRLERIASEYTHMQYLVDRAGPSLPFIRSLEPRISRITQALHAELSDLLSSVLASRPPPLAASAPSRLATAPALAPSSSYRQDLITTLRTFLSLGLVHEAEEIIRCELVHPFVTRVITRDSLSKPLPPSPLPPDGSSAPDPASASTARVDAASSPRDVATEVEETDSSSAATPATVSTSAIPAPYRIDRLPVPANRPPPRDGTDLVPLAELYNRILDFVERECGTVLDVAERVLEPHSVPGAGSGSGSGLDAGAGEGEGGSKMKGVGPLRDADEGGGGGQGGLGTDLLRKEGSIADSGDPRPDDQDEAEAENARGRRRVAGFQVLSNVVVDEVAQAIMSELGGVVFAAGRPTVFHQHYRLTTEFLARLEALSPTVARLDALRSHPTWTTLLKRFQLAVYFQLRLKEAVLLIERAFEMGSASGGGAKDVATSSSSSGATGAGRADGPDEGFVMSESEAVWKAFERCWDDDVWLVELAGRFWKLTLQILSRYRTWLNDKVPRYVLPTSASSANLPAEGDRERGRLTPNSSTPRPGTPGPSEADTVSEEATLRQLTVLIADARTMERRARRLYADRIRNKLPRAEGDSLAAGEDDNEDLETAAIEEAVSGVTSFVPSLSSQVVTILVKRCAEHLKLVRSVASQVRASTRKGPIEPSYFVHNILKELKAYLNGPGRVVEEELRKKWATAVVEDIAARYTAILSTQKKTEDSLRWLKKGRQGLSFFGRAASSAIGGAADEAGGGEDDRVKMQMQLDVETLAQDAVALNVDVDASEAFLALKRAAKGDVPKEDEAKK